MDLRKLARNTLADARTFGFVPVLRDLAYRAINRAAVVRIMHGLVLTEDRRKGPARPNGTSGRHNVRIVEADELYAAATCPEWAEGLTPQFLDGVLERGDKCVGVFDGTTLASTGWYTRLPTPISDTMELHFDASWVYAYKGFTLPAYRGGHLHGVGKHFALAYWLERGARGLISYVDFNNLQSKHAMARAGYREFGEIVLVGSGRYERAWSSPGCRPYRFRLLPR